MADVENDRAVENKFTNENMSRMVESRAFLLMVG